jgi:hypothetical protein
MRKVYVCFSDHILQTETFIHAYCHALQVQATFLSKGCSSIGSDYDEIDVEFTEFLVQLKRCGWNTTKLLLEPGEWRYTVLLGKTD